MNLYTYEELSALPIVQTFVFDVESYPNYFLIAFRNVISDKCILFESSPDKEISVALLQWLLYRICIVGFNSHTYDILLVSLVTFGYTDPKFLKDASDAIIYNNLLPRDFQKQYGIKVSSAINHIDLFEVAPLHASLKLYGARLHCPHLQDLPYPDQTYLTQEQAGNVATYCINDLELTKLLLIELKPHIDLREDLGRQYGRDMRSLSDAQVAEAIISSELHKTTGYYPRRPSGPTLRVCRYNVPAYMYFQTPALQAVLEAVRNAEFPVMDNGTVTIPKSISALTLRIGRNHYKMGIGGLHSQEKEIAYVADADTDLIDRDVAGYYPAIILNQGLFPSHLGPAFLVVYKSIVDRRLAAKKAGDKKISEGLKIAVNGIFGKLGNQYSIVYAPDLMLQVTLSGQLSLLMLIEMIDATFDIPIVSGNTDGIVIKCPKNRYVELNMIIEAWEKFTGFTTEETRYKAIYSRDVNNYIAVKEDGTCKVKGVYSEKGSAQNSILSKNPETLILSDAVQLFLTRQTPIQKTIKECTDIRRFVAVRAVKGGAEKDGNYLGKSIRWYYAKKIVGTIDYKLTGNKVPKTDGAKPLMTLPDKIPADLNYDYYIEEAVKMLFDIGYYVKEKTPSFF